MKRRQRKERWKAQPQEPSPSHLRFSFALGSEKLEEGEFEGLATVFGNLVDAWIPTIVDKGAFRKTLAERGKSVPLLWQHRMDEPIGVIKEIRENGEGLYVRGFIIPEGPGKMALGLLRKAKELNRLESAFGLSIGFDPIKTTEEKKPDGKILRHIQEAKLWEVSVVTVGANEKARVTNIHGACERHQAGFEVQTVIFPKNKWDSVAECKKWLKDHDFKADAVDETEESWRFRQRDPDDFLRLRTICINPGRNTSLANCKIKAVGGPMREGQATDSATAERFATIIAESFAHELELQLAVLPDFLSSIEASARAFSSETPGGSEEWVGRVLSKKNIEQIRGAIALLTKLVDRAKKPVRDDDDDEPYPAKGNKRKSKMTSASIALELMEAEIVEAESLLTGGGR